MTRSLTPLVPALLLGAALSAPLAHAAPADTAPATAAPTGDASITIPFEQYTLGNGLTVILSEDHSVPFVHVELWYDVGAKDEEAGRSGFAHLFEHLMFQGSENLDDDYFVPLQRIGARINGTTNTDRTNYFEGVPSEYLPLALWLESDRMGWLLPALTEEKLQNQKDVVRNERRQSYENRPYGLSWQWLYEAAYPEDHPYHIPTIGRHEDIEAATMDDVRAFFETWYVPNNTTLVICGDFDRLEARELVARYFSEIPRGADVQSLALGDVDAPVLTEEVVVRKTDQVPHEKFWIAWHSPAFFADGDADLDILSSVLSDGKDSRLVSELVREQQIAKEIRAYQSSSRLGSLYVITGTAAEGHTTDQVIAGVDEILAELRADGPTADEIAVARINWEAYFYGGLLNIQTKASMLARYELFTGDPGFIQQDLARYMGVTEDSVHDAVNTWLPADKRVVLHITPATEEGK